MKLSEIPVTQCTLPPVDYKAAKQAQFWLEQQYGVRTTIWKVHDEYLLKSDDYRWIGKKFMMVRVVDAAYLYAELEIEPPND